MRFGGASIDQFGELVRNIAVVTSTALPTQLGKSQRQDARLGSRSSLFS
jgi:hypothetical protein